MGRALARGVTAGVLSVSLAGCGGGSPLNRGASPPGAVVFAQACQVCHSLVGNESERKQGGDLVGYRMSRASLAQFTREMPVRHRLDAAALKAVVDYVLAVERRRSG